MTATVRGDAPGAPLPAGIPAEEGLAQRYDRLLEVLADRVVNDATGSRIPVGTRLPDAPQSRAWLGMLSSEPQLVADQRAGPGHRSRLIPSAQGFSFRVASLPVSLDATVTAACYIALHPTADEQQNLVSAGSASPGSPTPAGQPSARPAVGKAGNGTRPSSQQGYKLAAVWSKCAMEPVKLTVEIDAAALGSRRVGADEITAALAAAARVPPGSELFRGRRPFAPPGSLPRDEDLLDAAAWDRYAAANLRSPGAVRPPLFSAALQVDIAVAEGGYEILLTVVNTTPVIGDQLIDGEHPFDSDYFDPLLYEVKLTALVDAPLRPYELEQVAQSYRYDRTVPAFGHAGAVEVTDADGGRTTLSTLFAARQRTMRVDAREAFTSSDGTAWPIDTSFAALTRDPVGTVKALVDAHRAWIEQEWSPAALYRLAAERGWDDAARLAADEDAAAARAEVSWVEAGLHVLQSDARVREAFVLANQVVEAAARDLSGKPAYTAWRPFQVAWIVGSLPGMKDPAAHPDVNIVWFATGGGKSEAYLGLMIATLFYGRLTGVTAGTQAWARFPLRLLALQQAERFAKMIFHAEILRRDRADMAGDSFGLGYFVGGGNTPNQLYDPSSPFYRGQDPESPETAEACRVLEACPLCGQRPEVSFDPASWMMRHICRTVGCEMAGILPVWGIDDDIYRNAPSVLVGTVDKLAQLGQARHFQVLLGRALTRCPRHGYTALPECAIFGCRDQRSPVTSGMGAVRLEIADELHLLEESLGALDGMYETLLQAISEHLGNPPLQIVGATATIEGYPAQVAHLYRRGSRRFPVNGPRVGETFWSTTSHSLPQRRFLGVQPRRITMVTAAREVALAHARWLGDLLTDPGRVLAEAGLDPVEADSLAAAAIAGRDLYEVLLTYCLRNEDLTSFTRDDDVQNLLPAQANLALINGDAEPSSIRDAVQRLVNPPAADEDRVKIIAATRAIGHGFDVARLGVMTVMGTPTTAAEIIQASSRIARRWPGLVIYIVNPTRDRDVSVYRYFSSWISFLDRLVSKVPVNRESLPVLKRVLSGGLMAWLLQVHDRGWVTGRRGRRRLDDSTAFRDAVDAGYISKQLLADNLTVGFGIPKSGVLFAPHRAAIESWVSATLTTVPHAAEGKVRLPALLTPPVPRSLRDIEDPITIHADL
jgi:hypothetical protein